jgi:hypothetical protein
LKEFDYTYRQDQARQHSRPLMHVEWYPDRSLEKLKRD